MKRYSGKVKLVTATGSQPRQWSKEELRIAGLYWDWICGRNKDKVLDGQLRRAANKR